MTDLARRRAIRVLGGRALGGLAVLMLAVGATIGFAPEAWAKSFTISSLDTRATVRPDGSMTVTEQATYDFDGEFSHLQRTFATGDIVGVEAAEGERPLAVEQSGGAGSTWEWAIPQTSGRHTYTFTYLVNGAIRAGSDVGELNWQFVGTDTSVPIGQVAITITMPGDGTGIRAWAHGPLNGVVTITANLVDLQVAPLPAHTFVEAHVVDPIENFTMTPGPIPLLPSILASEQRDADAANAARADARARIDRRRILQIATPFVIVIGLIGFVVIWLVWGREPRRPDDIGDYWREVPDDRPAVGRSLLHFGDVDSSAFSATVVDLAQRGYLRITEERTDRMIGKDKVTYRFENLLHADVDGLEPWERSLMQRLFDGVETSTQDDFIAWARANQSTAQSFWTSFRQGIKTDVKSAGYLSQHRAMPLLLAVGVVLGLGGFGAIVLAAGSLLGIVAIAAAVIVGLFIRVLRQRTITGARRAAEWAGLKRFLTDFSRLDEAVSGDMILYERYLVAAVALGVADELVKGLAVKVPQVVNDPAFATWYVASSLGSGPGGFDLSGLASFDSTFGATTTAFTPQSSGSGSGGGFSGGGGGGGGGGGFGAS